MIVWRARKSKGAQPTKRKTGLIHLITYTMQLNSGKIQEKIMNHRTGLSRSSVAGVCLTRSRITSEWSSSSRSWESYCSSIYSVFPFILAIFWIGVICYTPILRDSYLLSWLFSLISWLGMVWLGISEPFSPVSKLKSVFSLPWVVSSWANFFANYFALK